MARGRVTAPASSGSSKSATTCQSACRQSQHGKGGRWRSHSFLWQCGPTVPADKTEWPQNEIKHTSEQSAQKQPHSHTVNCSLLQKPRVMMGRERSL